MSFYTNPLSLKTKEENNAACFNLVNGDSGSFSHSSCFRFASDLFLFLLALECSSVSIPPGEGNV